MVNHKPLPFYFHFGCTYRKHPRVSTEMYILFFADDAILLGEFREELMGG